MSELIILEPGPPGFTANIGIAVRDHATKCVVARMSARATVELCDFVPEDLDAVLVLDGEQLGGFASANDKPAFLAGDHQLFERFQKRYFGTNHWLDVRLMASGVAASSTRARKTRSSR